MVKKLFYFLLFPFTLLGQVDSMKNTVILDNFADKILYANYENPNGELIEGLIYLKDKLSIYKLFDTIMPLSNNYHFINQEIIIFPNNEGIIFYSYQYKKIVKQVKLPLKENEFVFTIAIDKKNNTISVVTKLIKSNKMQFSIFLLDFNGYLLQNLSPIIKKNDADENLSSKSYILNHCHFFVFSNTFFQYDLKKQKLKTISNKIGFSQGLDLWGVTDNKIYFWEYTNNRQDVKLFAYNSLTQKRKELSFLFDVNSITYCNTNKKYDNYLLQMVINNIKFSITNELLNKINAIEILDNSFFRVNMLKQDLLKFEIK